MLVATVGSDKYLRIYSYAHILENKTLGENPMMRAVELQGAARVIDFSPDGKFLAIGYENGQFEVFGINLDDLNDI
jgi:hypothetical protein